MKSQFVKVALFCLLQVVVLANSNGAIITQWTFETSPPGDLADSATIGGIAADSGTGTASGVHASAATDWTTPAGNGSANSLSSNNWSVGDYYQFSMATTGFENIMVAWAQTSSATGPGEFRLAYSIGAGPFISHVNYVVLPNQSGAPGLGAWTSGSAIGGYNYAFDLSAVVALDNAASVDFRLIMRTLADATPPGTVALAGTSRVDNFAIEGSAIAAVPEPGPFGLLGSIAGCGWIGARVRRIRHPLI